MMNDITFCKREDCFLIATHESFLPGGWVPECTEHALETRLANERADCFKQCLFGNHDEMFWW